MPSKDKENPDLKTALVTGACGFIGFHVSRELLRRNYAVVGVDNLNHYYDPSLKKARLAMLAKHPKFQAHHLSIEQGKALEAVFRESRPQVVLHLAAQAGVRHGLHFPRDYVQSNLVGTHEVLESVRQFVPDHFLFASSSSVYGANDQFPFRETDSTDRPMSLYAATKRSCEALCHSYSHIYGIPTTGLRFFTVYGPWGRPDMALFKFVDRIRTGKEIDVYGNGMKRDFTYIDDIVAAVLSLIETTPIAAKPRSGLDSISPVAPYRTVNICRGAPTELTTFIDAIEAALGTKALQRHLPAPSGDVLETHGSADLLRQLTGLQPVTDIRTGVQQFVEWHRDYYSHPG